MSALDTEGSSSSHLELAFVAGHDDALRSVYDRFGGLVFTLCCRKLPRHLAEEATQHVFVSAWQNRHRFDPAKGSLGAWLTGIARYRIIDIARSEERSARSDDALAQHPTGIRSSDTDAIIEHLLVSDAIAELADRPAKVLTMSLYDELTHVEIAARLDLPVGTVKSDIRRGLEHVRRALKGAV